MVICGRCGAGFELSSRNVRAARARGEDTVCHECRHPAKPRDLAKYRAWWLERFGLVEIRELAEGIWQCAAPTAGTLSPLRPQLDAHACLKRGVGEPELLAGSFYGLPERGDVRNRRVDRR